MVSGQIHLSVCNIAKKGLMFNSLLQLSKVGKTFRNCFQLDCVPNCSAQVPLNYQSFVEDREIKVLSQHKISKRI
jgi:hypothetical protein